MIQGRKHIARALLVSLALGGVVPASVEAQQTPPPVPSRTPVPSNETITAPSPVPTMAVTGTPIPYPAYGTPAPDVAQQLQKPGVPQSVTLAQSVDIAVAGSPVFNSERAQYEAIRAKYYAEEGALYPAVSANASWTRTFGSSNGNVSSPSPTNTSFSTGSNGPVTNEGAQLSVTQLIYDGGRVIAAVRSAKEADVAGKQTFLRNLQTLAFNVATAYYAVLQADATVDADNQLVREFEVNEDNVRAAIRTGAEARSDLAAAEFQTAQARGNLITAQGQVINAQAVFATTLGLDADSLIQPQPRQSMPSPRSVSYVSALQQAYALRPDYIAAEHTVESSKENVRFAKLARFPVLSIGGNFGGSQVAVQGGSNTHFANTKGYGATLTIPIYDQNQTNYNVALAVSQLDQANASLVLTKLTVESNVRSALSGIITARAVLAQAASELRSAQVSLQAIQAQYKVGASTITAVITAEANLATAQSFDITSLYNDFLAEQNYEYALGTIDLTL